MEGKDLKDKIQEIIYDAYFPCRGGVEKSKKAAEEIYRLMKADHGNI
jgi:hypothetical protein